MSSLNKVTILDYRNIRGGFKPWLSTEKIPSYFWDIIKKIQPETNIESLLHKIDEELMNLYGEKRDTARSFIDSRFSKTPQILKRGMVSCGALSRVHGTVLRNLGIPVKLVHGRLRGQKGEDRHSWIKIYNPKTKEWVAVDPTQDRRGFKLLETARQIKIYSSWEEMKKDYLAGKF